MAGLTLRPVFSRNCKQSRCSLRKQNKIRGRRAPHRGCGVHLRPRDAPHALHLLLRLPEVFLHLHLGRAGRTRDATDGRVAKKRTRIENAAEYSA